MCNFLNLKVVVDNDLAECKPRCSAMKGVFAEVTLFMPKTSKQLEL